MDPKKNIFTTLLLFILLTGCDLGQPASNENSDPVLVEYPVVYIERDIFTVDATDEDDAEQAEFSITDPTVFNPGANLFIKENAAANSQAVNLTGELFSASLSSNDSSTGSATANRIDIRDLSVSENGDEFLVSIRAPEIESADDDEQPTWNVWHYSHSTKELQRVIKDDALAEQGDDLMPSFLPDGRIIFSSNRQRLSKAILLDEGKSQYQGQNERQSTGALNIHVMQADGSSIKQLTYNLSHDFYPLVIQNGKVLYSRWDAMGGINKINLYQMNPDGTENHFLYGWHSQQITIDEQNLNISLIKPQQLPNGDIFFMLSSQEGTRYQKLPIVININEFIDENTAIESNVSVDESAISLLFSSTQHNYNFSESLNESGRLSHLYPLPDNSKRYLLSLDLCRVIIDDKILACSQLSEQQKQDESLVFANPAYELWLLNENNNTQKLVARPSTDDKMLTEAIILQPSEINDEFIADKAVGDQLDSELYNQQAAAVHIRSVYDFAGVDTTANGIDTLKDPTQTTVAQQSARFIRVLRGVPMPSNDVRRVRGTDFGRSSGQLMREIIGYSPIQPDGSVKIKVPANVPLAVNVLDEEGKRIGGRHRQWITVKAGETLECNGCHASNNTSPHGRVGAEPLSINSGAVSGGVPFPNTNNAILAEVGQTMAEAAENTFGLAELSSDLIYSDIWTDSALSAVNPDLNLLYSSLTTASPEGSSCFENWLAYCRIQINYEAHIAPIWAADRQVYNALTDSFENQPCVSCHQPTDAVGANKVPDGQLDLSATPSDQQALHFTSYRELFFNDDEQELIEGIVTNKLVEVTDNNGDVVYVKVTDNDIESETFGELILALDENDQPIPELTTVTKISTMSTAGASSSSRFFNILEQEDFTTVDHRNMLTPSEIRLISEWLDIGGQYYNNPFYPQP